MELWIRKSQLRDRGGIVYVDCHTNYGRLRFSTGETYSKENIADLASRVKELCISFLQGRGVKERVERSRDQNLGDLSVFGELWLKTQCSSIKPQTLRNYKNHIKLLKEKIPFDLGLLDQAAYDEIIIDMAKERLGVLNRLITYAKECGVITERIFTYKARKLEIKEPNIKPLTLQEAKAVLAKASERARESKRWLEFRNYIAFAIFSGARVGEILALQESDIDFTHLKVSITKSKLRNSCEIGTTKTGKGRYIDLLPNAKAAIESQIALKREKHITHPKANVHRLFSFDENDLSKMWHEILAACGLEPRIMYQTRHSFATIMLTNGEEPLWISAMLGHSSLHTTFTHYVKYIPNQKDRASFVEFGLEGVE